MTRRGGLVAGALAFGLLLLVWVSSTRPVSILSGGRVADFPTPTASVPSPGSSARSGREQAEEDQIRPTMDLGWVGDLISVLVLGVLLVGLVLAFRWVWRNRWHPPERPATGQFEVLPEVDAVSAALARDIESQFAAVLGGSPRNGIVECWHRLESIVGEAGLPRKPWETSVEFTVRVLKRLDLDPRAISDLSRLYREARFSEHELDESHRVAARSALQRLHSDLQETTGGLQGTQG